jgi:pimeloyl-ACP methyl ester carboxylesterase
VTRRCVSLVGGLNNRLEALAPLADALAGMGFSPQPLALPVAAPTTPASEVIDKWRQAVVTEYANLAASTPTRSFDCVAYSVGGLIALQSALQSPLNQPRRLVLLAPPLCLRHLARKVIGIARLGSWFGLAVPSLAPEGIRLRRSTPMSEYVALSTLSASISKGFTVAGEALPQIYVVLGSHDELVDGTGVASWIGRRHLSWPIAYITTRSRPVGSGHLLISPAAMSPAEWRRLIVLVTDIIAS